MSKCSEELKLKVVNYYLNNHYGREYVAKQFDIPPSYFGYNFYFYTFRLKYSFLNF